MWLSYFLKMRDEIYAIGDCPGILFFYAFVQLSVYGARMNF